MSLMNFSNFCLKWIGDRWSSNLKWNHTYNRFQGRSWRSAVYRRHFRLRTLQTTFDQKRTSLFSSILRTSLFHRSLSDGFCSEVWVRVGFRSFSFKRINKKYLTEIKIQFHQKIWRIQITWMCLNSSCHIVISFNWIKS
jgi:hypothetical protein